MLETWISGVAITLSNSAVVSLAEDICSGPGRPSVANPGAPCKLQPGDRRCH